MLDPTSSLPRRPRRVLVAGRSGSGKTTLAIRIASALDLPHIEIDAWFHGPKWTPRQEFRAEVEDLASSPQWVTEWQYDSARLLLASRADLLVWLDLPFRLALGRLVRRTLRRRWRREGLWNGNVEPPLYTFLTDREHVVRYMIGRRHQLASLVPEVAARHPSLVVVRLTSPADVETWLARLH